MGLLHRCKNLLLGNAVYRDPGIALITGANKGIGKEVVRQLASLGWKVFLTARNPSAGSLAADLVGPAVSFIEMDVTDECAIRRAVMDVSRSAEVIDVLINNAAILDDADQTVFDTPIDVFRRSYETNCLGALLVTKHVLPLLRKSRSARIINVSSEAGQLSSMHHHVPAYVSIVRLPRTRAHFGQQHPRRFAIIQGFSRRHNMADSSPMT